MKDKPRKFSDQFNLDKAKLAELGVFDPILNFDTKLFVEPLLLKTSSSQLMREAFNNYNIFFVNLLKLLKGASRGSDLCWRQAKRLVRFPEYKHTCIGYGSGTINGNGSGNDLNDKILQTAQEIVKVAEDCPDIFLLLPLLEEGIGADIISDMTQDIIDYDICEYTVGIMKQLGIEGTQIYTAKSVNGDSKAYMLPYNSYYKCAIKLLPLDILSNLPLADTFDDWLVEQSNVNQEMREQVNKIIGINWLETTKAEKKQTVLELIKKDKSFFLAVLSTLQTSTFEHYDLEKDYEGLYRWLEDSKQFMNVDQLNVMATERHGNEVSLHYIVENITCSFKLMIEDNELWRIFWTEHYSKLRHVKEFYSQMLFFMVSSAWLSAKKSNITVEHFINKASQQLEFTFSRPGCQQIKVQVKHSNNYAGLKKGYEEQLEQCSKKGMQCFYVVLDFDAEKSKQLKDILNIEQPLCKIIEIDSSHKDSHSPPVASVYGFDGMVMQFEGIEVEESYYKDEKKSGGESSNKANKPLKEKVRELCMGELDYTYYPSARQLCSAVIETLESDYPELLEKFKPYKQKNSSFDWTKPTFYGWCNTVFKDWVKANTSTLPA